MLYKNNNVVITLIIIIIITVMLMSVLVFFYGRNGLPVPLRHPVKMVSGPPVHVKQEENPSEATVAAVHAQVVESLRHAYNSPGRPAWETRPLVIL